MATVDGEINSDQTCMVEPERPLDPTYGPDDDGDRCVLIGRVLVNTAFL